MLDLVRELLAESLDRTGRVVTVVTVLIGALAGAELSHAVHVTDQVWLNITLLTLAGASVAFLIDLFFVSPIRLLQRARRTLPGTGVTFSHLTVEQMNVTQGGDIHATAADLLSSAHLPMPSEPDRPWMDPVDANRGTFNSLSLRLTDLIPRDGNAVVAGKTFVNCTIYGPAIVVVQHADFIGTTFDMNRVIQSIFYSLPLDRLAHPLVGPVLVTHCRFLDHCRFIGVGFMGPGDDLDRMLRSIAPPPTEPSDDSASQTSKSLAISSQDQMWSAIPAAIAGVRG